MYIHVCVFLLEKAWKRYAKGGDLKMGDKTGKAICTICLPCEADDVSRLKEREQNSEGAKTEKIRMLRETRDSPCAKNAMHRGIETQHPRAQRP
jgi:hypothetical protein